ncbi:MAG: hypothetical protein HYX56_01050 [Chloroflexi bacterium]|nr:hypothetical protein [Chloroflexota bacterium]
MNHVPTQPTLGLSEPGTTAVLQDGASGLATHSDNSPFVSPDGPTTTASAAPADEAEPERDPTRALRAKALACTAPLHDLQRNRGLRGWDAFDLYDLSLVAIDLVVDKMGFDSGIGADELVGALASRARKQVPGTDFEQARAVAEGVVGALIRPSVAEYTSELEDVRRQFEFALLTEHERTEGTIYLRATSQAINVLVGGLNVDVESAQMAAEATLEHLLRRQRLADAAVPAREAKIRSVQYADYVRRLIEDTRRDVRRAGWREQVPERLSEIRGHLTERMDTERKLLAAIQEQRGSAEREDLREHAARLVEIVNDCFDRHSELHRVTLEAARVYIEERDRQTFGRVSAIRGVDLTDELLLPALASPIDRVEPVIAAVASRLIGMGPGSGQKVTPWRQLSLTWFVRDLLHEVQHREELGEPVTDPAWEEPAPDPLEFDEHTRGSVGELLDALTTPQRLSRLLVTALERGFNTADLLRLRALVATAPEILATDPEQRLLIAAPIAASFRLDGFAGDDLLVGLATVLADEAPGAAGRTPH